MRGTAPRQPGTAVRAVHKPHSASVYAVVPAGCRGDAAAVCAGPVDGRLPGGAAGEDAAGRSPTTISRLTATWDEEYRGFRHRELSGCDYVYVWVDGIHFNIRLEEDRLCTLVVIGVKADGTKELVVLEDGYRGEPGELGERAAGPAGGAVCGRRRWRLGTGPAWSSSMALSRRAGRRRRIGRRPPDHVKGRSTTFDNSSDRIGLSLRWLGVSGASGLRMGIADHRRAA